MGIVTGMGKFVGTVHGEPVTINSMKQTISIQNDFMGCHLK